MNCRDAERQIFAERDGLLDLPQQAAVAEHVAHCAACRRTRNNLAAAIESWRVATQAVAAPDADREWEAVRRQMRGGVGSNGQVSAARQRRVLSWVALPLGAAAAVALAFFMRPASSSSIAANVARADSVEVSAADGSVVYVDDKSGWVVIWEGEAGARAI
jgi:hypothetical protein